MTHKEAVRKALEMLGGKAQLKQIYPVAIKLIGNNTKSVDIKATIRRELNSSPMFFKATPDEEGSWELISYQEELVKKDQQIADLQAQLSAKDEELKSIKTEDAFVRRLVNATKNLFGVSRKHADYVRQVLLKLGRDDEQEELLAWIERREQKSIKKVTKKIIQKTINKGNTYVDHQTIFPNVGNYKPEIHNQHLDVPMPPLGQKEQELLEDE